MPRSGVSRRRVLASLGAAPMATMLPPAQARSSIDNLAPAAGHVIRTEPMASLTLQLRLIAPLDAATGSAIIEGGEALGPAFTGAVLPGSLEWSHDPLRGVTQLTVRYGVQTHGGHRLQLVDRASFPAGDAASWNHPVTTATEMEAVPDPLAAVARGLLIGRMDASQMHAGTLRLDLHRVL